MIERIVLAKGFEGSKGKLSRTEMFLENNGKGVYSKYISSTASQSEQFVLVKLFLALVEANEVHDVKRALSKLSQSIFLVGVCYEVLFFAFVYYLRGINRFPKMTDGVIEWAALISDLRGLINSFIKEVVTSSEGTRTNFYNQNSYITASIMLADFTIGKNGNQTRIFTEKQAFARELNSYNSFIGQLIVQIIKNDNYYSIERRKNQNYKISDLIKDKQSGKSKTSNKYPYEFSPSLSIEMVVNSIFRHIDAVENPLRFILGGCICSIYYDEPQQLYFFVFKNDMSANSLLAHVVENNVKGTPLGN